VKIVVGITILYCTEFISSAYPGVLERCCWSCPNFLAFISVKRNRSTPSGKERFGWGFFVLAKSWWQEGRRTGKLDGDGGQGRKPGGGRTEWPPQSSVSAAYSCAANPGRRRLAPPLALCMQTKYEINFCSA